MREPHAVYIHASSDPGSFCRDCFVHESLRRPSRQSDEFVYDIVARIEGVCRDVAVTEVRVVVREVDCADWLHLVAATCKRLGVACCLVTGPLALGSLPVGGETPRVAVRLDSLRPSDRFGLTTDGLLERLEAIDSFAARRQLKLVCQVCRHNAGELLDIYFWAQVKGVGWIDFKLEAFPNGWGAVRDLGSSVISDPAGLRAYREDLEELFLRKWRGEDQRLCNEGLAFFQLYSALASREGLAEQLESECKLAICLDGRSFAVERGVRSERPTLRSGSVGSAALQACKR